MRVVIIVVLALVVLGGGGAGAYFYFMKPAEASISDEANEHHEESMNDKADGAHGDDGHGTKDSAFDFVELDPIVLPILDSSGVTQTINLVVALEVKKRSKVSLVEKARPKLTNAYIQDMYGALNRHAALKGGAFQLSEMKARLQKATNRIVGKDVVSDVLLQMVQQKPI